MNLNTVLQRIPAWYKAGSSIYLKSGPGLGKTTTIEAARPMLSKMFGKNIGIVIINGANLNLADATGYLIPKDMDGVSYSTFTRPFWWTTSEGKNLEEYDGGIIFIDEADKAGLDEKKILGEAAESKRLASHKLPDGWVVWMAGNRSEDRSGSTKELDHLINRRREINIEPHVPSWVDWAEKNGIMAETIIFAQDNPNIVFEGKVPDKQGPWCTPRSLCKADRYLRVLAEANGDVIPTDPITIEEISGDIGSGAASQYFATIRLGQEMPKFEEIVARPTTTKVPAKPDGQMLVCYKLAHMVDQNTAENVITYIERMPPEFAVTFAKAACRREPELVNVHAFIQWCQNNASLMTAIFDQK